MLTSYMAYPGSSFNPWYHMIPPTPESIATCGPKVQNQKGQVYLQDIRIRGSQSVSPPRGADKQYTPCLATRASAGAHTAALPSKYKSGPQASPTLRVPESLGTDRALGASLHKPAIASQGAAQVLRTIPCQ